MTSANTYSDRMERFYGYWNKIFCMETLMQIKNLIFKSVCVGFIVRVLRDDQTILL